MMTLDTDGSFMAKELEAEDIELKEYSFTPKEIRINGITVLDYTEVENDKVFLCNKKDILDKPRPSWIPELDSKGLAIDKFLPICVKDFSDGNYFVQSKVYTGERDTKGIPIYKKQIYKMSPDVLAATVDYYLKRKRAELKTEGSSEKVSLPRRMNSMPTSRYNEISKLCLLCNVPSLKYKNVDKSITDKAFEMKGKSPGKLYQIQNNVVFLEQWQPLLENIKGKRLDMNYQKQDYIDSYSKAVETAYGDSNTFNNLYSDFGIKIKKQNGSTFSKEQVERLSDALGKVWKHYGNLSKLAGEYNLKVSYADNCMQFARKNIGLFTPFHNAIGISFFNEAKQLSVAGINHLPDVTLAHEVAHWLDSQKGKESHNFFASDKYGSLENQIATKFKEEIKLREKSNKSATRIGKADEIHLGEYWHRTCECFARAMEQYYALKQGIDLSEEIAYARKDNFEEDFIPLIEELMEENKRHFGINDISHGISNSSVPELLKPNLKDLKKYSESYAKIINEENAVLKTKPDTFNYLRGANKSMDNKVYAYHEKMLRIGIKKTALEIQLKIAARLPFSKNELSEYEKTDVCNIDKESISLMDKNTFEYFTTVINSVLLNGGYKPKREFPFVLRKESGEVNFWKLKIDEEDNTQVISASINTMAKEEFYRIEEQNTKVKGEYLLAAEEEFLRREEPYKVVDAYSISTKSIYDNVIKRLDSEGYVCRTQLKLSEYRTPSFSELDEYIKENSKKYQPVIVLFDEYNDYDKTTNEYKTIKAWQIYDKESLENGTYISLGKCKINYLNENLELEYKGPFVAPGSQITARSYYNSKGTRELCHVIKEADRNSEKYKNAIETAASYIAEHIHKSRHTYLVPAPNHNGKAEYTYDIARIVGLKINAPVFNILECKPHETLYEQKKKNLEPDVELFLNDYGKSVISNFPEGRNYIYLIDNCISTGLTFNKAAELINGLIPAVYAIGNFAEVKYVNEKYKVNNLLELKNEITHEENKLMENQEISKYSFIVKDNSEYGSDFEPVKNLSATEAVRLFQKLNESDISENRFGIALHIPGDKVFGEWAEEGISIVTLDDTEKANFSIYGDTFITQLKESDDRSRTYIDAYKDLYNALEQSSKENSENYGVVYPDFLFEKEKELFSEHSVNENKTIEIKPVTLEEILDVMDMRPDYTQNGNFMIYDTQRQEYISGWVGMDEEDGAAIFHDAQEAFERLDIYINDYYIHDMQEQLEAVGVEISGNETLSDLCNLYKAELEKGNTKLSEGELNLAMGIVEPDTVTYEHKLMKGKPLEKDETNELCPTFTLFASASEERITELKEHFSQNGYDVKWIQIEDSSVPRFTCDIDSKAYIQTILEERGIDYSFKLGLLASGYDASWLTEDEQLDAEVVTEEEFKRINEIREKEFKDLKLPYIKIDFTEGTTSSHKPAMMESGTVLGLKEGEELLNELNRRFNTFLKCDVSVNFPDAKDNEPGSYSLRYDFHDDKRTLENGKEVSFEREGLSDYIRMTCSYPEVLEKYEQQWQKVNAPNITEEQKKLVADIVEPNYEKLKEAYIQHCKTLKPILEGDKKVHSSWIINKDVSDVSKSSVEKEKESIAVSFERYAGICINHIADYLNENKDLSFKDEFISYAGHQISNMLQDVKYGESRNAKYGEHGYDFDFSLWRSSLEKVMDASEYNSYFTERLMAEEKRYKEIKNTAKDMGMNSEKNFDFTSLADRICQNGFEASASGFDYNFDFSEIAEMAGKNESWVKENLHEICEALTGHNDELLLDFNENEALSEDGTIHLNFCSVGEDYNELFKKGDDGRWIRKTNLELLREGFEVLWQPVALYSKQDEKTGIYHAVYDKEVEYLNISPDDNGSYYRKPAGKNKEGELLFAVQKGNSTDFSNAEIIPASKLSEYLLNKNNIEIQKIIDEGVEAIQANGGMSEAALEAEYEAQLREQEMELDDEPEEALPVWPINGEAFFESEIEENLKADVEELFRQYDSGETEKNLTLVGVKMYRDPAKDGKISLLVEFDSKNPENRWREDSLFNALNEEGIEFNGMKVDFNPITKEKSGTIEQYLKQLAGFENEEQLIKANAQKLEEKEIENKLNDISNRLSEIDSDEQRILPFSIFENKEKGRVNIKFDTAKINRDILKELKAHGWKYAASTKQWYPVGKAVKTASDFANRLQEKYSETRNPNMEKPMGLGPEKSPYDEIRFFDRNYNESEDFAKFFNSNIHLFKKGKESAITEEDAAIILKAIGYEKDGIVEQRKLRVGLDNKDKIVILTSENGNVKTEKIELSDILEFAKNKAEERVIESKQMLQNYLGKEPVVKKDLQDIFISLYETCVTQSEEIDSKMKLLYDSFIGKKHEQVKEAVLYQRNSYRGWEISTDKDFKKSVYCRPFEQTDRSGYILMAGKEGKDGFWQEKFVREMLKSNNWSERDALIETLTTLASDKETCTVLGIKEPQSLNGFFSSLDKIIHVENDTDIKNELMESLLGPYEAHKVLKESTKKLSVGDKLGEDTVSDLFWISDGVCQATLSREVNGVGSAQNYFVIDNSIINQLDEELKELVVSFDSKSVIENKSYEPYILKELIEKGLMPPRDDDFIQQLDEYISVHPLKYEKLKPVDYLNFERKLQEIAEVDKAFNKTPFELGQQLIALVDESDRERLNIWLRKQGCDSKEHMAEVFDSWLNNKEQKKDITQKKNNGYPPRGEQ